MNIIRFQSVTKQDKYYLEIALRLREQSDDPKSKFVKQSGVGAVIANEQGLIAKSANVIPDRLRNHIFDRTFPILDSERYEIIEHAERAAIYKAHMNAISLVGATIYCSRFPCIDCARALVGVGIARAVFSSGFSGELRWLESQRVAMKILRNAGVTVRILKIE